jgi:hypothetical protein
MNCGHVAPLLRWPAKGNRAARTAFFPTSVWHTRQRIHGVRSSETGRKACVDRGLEESAGAVTGTVQRVAVPVPAMIARDPDHVNRTLEAKASWTGACHTAAAIALHFVMFLKRLAGYAPA